MSFYDTKGEENVIYAFTQTKKMLSNESIKTYTLNPCFVDSENDNSFNLCVIKSTSICIS